MAWQLRPYQEEGIANLRALMAQGKRRIIRQLPTGGGKTVEIKTITEAAAARGRRVCLMAHRQELLEQLSAAIDVPHGWIKANKPMASSHAVQVASVQTLARRKERYDFDLLIVDEAHHSKAAQYRAIIEHYSNAFVLGFTATPHRLDGRGFDDVFEDIVLGPSVSQLVAGGYLKPAIYYGPPEKVKLSGVKKTAGDYNNPQLASVMNESRITGNAIEHYAKHAAGVPAILFGVNRAHIQAAADMFNGAGFRFVAVDGTMDRKVIKRALQDLATRRIDGICSCELISEGVDIPAVSAGIMLRPTQSLSLWLQQLGRCLRPAEGFDTAIILDHAGNTLIHGFAHDEREWSLFGECDETGVKRKRKQRELETKFIQCDNCLLIHERAAECPACGHLHVDPSSVCGDGELVLLEGASARLSRLDIEMRKADWKDLYADMVRLGHKSGWAYYEFKKLYPNDVVINDHDRLIIPQVATLADKELVYTRLLTECKVKGYKPGRASFKFKEMFGTWPQGFTTRVKHELGYGLEEMEEWQKNFRKAAQ